MKSVILLKYGEIFLKKLNRKFFEKRLLEDIKEKLKRCGSFNVTQFQSTVFLEPTEDNFNTRIAIELLKKVFGISKICVAFYCPKEIEKIKSLAFEVLESRMNEKNIKSFKVETVREDKNFFLNSMQINVLIGSFILEKFRGLKVNVRNPEIILNIEIRKKCYVYVQCIKGLGGMPTKTNGRALALLSGGIDSPVAAFMLGKRGVEIETIHFHSYPYTSERAKEKVIELLNKLSEYLGKMSLFIVPFTDIQLALIKNINKKYLTIFIRRYMMKIAEKIAIKNSMQSLITGESVGQVASQTMESIVVTDNSVSLPIFRPLIGMDKNEIISISRNIGTYEISILPYEDCCTLFVPKHPIIKPKLKDVIEIEKNLEKENTIKEMLDESIKNSEIISSV
ncbi:MAG: tRNA 4-thiouridine(8) synthase ThiI [Clostridiales bacterium]|jgi:thiamine biosynthesis protein ThiI|nr:tRNA 4-thiouridine(8) synthase ThiI [Clostridiales bacterium]